jgi:type I site-specific restriction endonuclease
MMMMIQKYNPTIINSSYLLPREGEEPNADQKTVMELVDQFIQDASKKSLVIRSKYGSGKTTFLRDLIKKQNFKKVLFITYRQTLARDIDRNFRQLGFKNYLDAHDHPEIWNAKRLIVQLDSLLNVLHKNDRFITTNQFEKYDLIILDESESLLNHFDEKTMQNKEIEIFNFFDLLIQQSSKTIFLDGDMSNRSLSFAKHYGELTYIKNMNTDGSKNLVIYQDRDRWETQLHEDLNRFYQEDKNFKICICSQSSKRSRPAWEEPSEPVSTS